MAGERNRREHYVPHDCIVVLCDERDERLRLFAESVNKIGFGWCLERGYVNSMDTRPISLFFSSNQHSPLSRHITIEKVTRRRESKHPPPHQFILHNSSFSLALALAP